MNNHSKTHFIKFLLVFFLGFASFYILKDLIKIDELAFFNKKTATITVRGTAQSNVTNQIAEFTAGIEAIAAEKAEATSLATEVMDQLLIEIYDFGINPQDIQTSQVSIYQEDEFIEPYLEVDSMAINPPKKTQKGDWRANISTTIILRHEDSSLLKNKSEEFLSILNNSQVNYVYGPNFRIDDQSVEEIELINQAVADARRKAEAIAASSQQKVTKVLEIVEDGGDYYPYYRGYDLALSSENLASVSLEPGSSILSKTVTVTFEVK